MNDGRWGQPTATAWPLSMRRPMERPTRLRMISTRRRRRCRDRSRAAATSAMAWPSTVACPRALVSMLFTLRDRLMGIRVLRVFAVAQAHPFRRAYPCGVEVDLRSPRTLQGVAAGFILLGFVADFRAVV